MSDDQPSRTILESPLGLAGVAGVATAPVLPPPPPPPPPRPRFAAGSGDAVVQLVSRQESLKAALEIAQAILAGREPDSLWGPIARRARRLVEADATIVRTPRPDGRMLVLRAIDRRRASSPQPGILLPGVVLREEPVADSVCGAVFQTGRARLVSDHLPFPAAGSGLLEARSRDVAGRVPTGPAMVVPLSAGGRVHGILMAVNDGDRPSFQRHDIDLLRLFAGQVALAIRQAEARRERQRLYVVEERERLARQLHDDAIQSLYGITLDLAAAAARIGDPVLRERMARLVWTVDDVIQDLRNHIYGLRPSVLAGRRLDAALRQLARDFEWQSGTATVAEIESAAAERLQQQADDVVQIVREALSNVGRHARARSCRVHLGLHQGEARLLVQDDGVGFDPRRVEVGGHGLRNFAARAARLGGRLEIDSSPNAGTALRIAIPLRLSRPFQRLNAARGRALGGPR